MKPIKGLNMKQYSKIIETTNSVVSNEKGISNSKEIDKNLKIIDSGTDNEDSSSDDEVIINNIVITDLEEYKELDVYKYTQEDIEKLSSNTNCNICKYGENCISYNCSYLHLRGTNIIMYNQRVIIVKDEDEYNYIYTNYPNVFIVKAYEQPEKNIYRWIINYDNQELCYLGVHCTNIGCKKYHYKPQKDNEGNYILLDEFKKLICPHYSKCQNINCEKRHLYKVNGMSICTYGDNCRYRLCKKMHLKNFVGNVKIYSFEDNYGYHRIKNKQIINYSSPKKLEDLLIDENTYITREEKKKRSKIELMV